MDQKEDIYQLSLLLYLIFTFLLQYMSLMAELGEGPEGGGPPAVQSPPQPPQQVVVPAPPQPIPRPLRTQVPGPIGVGNIRPGPGGKSPTMGRQVR